MTLQCVLRQGVTFFYHSLSLLSAAQVPPNCSKSGGDEGKQVTGTATGFYPWKTVSLSVIEIITTKYQSRLQGCYSVNHRSYAIRHHLSWK